MHSNRLWPIFLLGLTLAVATLSVYWQVGNHEFLNLDDPSFVAENVHVNSGFTEENIVWAFTSVSEPGWYPVTWLSHMLDVQLYGLDPRGHHLTNAFIHTAAALILFLFLFRLTNAPYRSIFVAALFALHPLHVESVAWVAERRDVLSAFFGFLALLLYTEYVRRQRLTSLYYLSLVVFVLGLLSKAVLVTLPFIMLLLDYWPLDRYGVTANSSASEPHAAISKFIFFLKEKTPFFVCSVIAAAITITVPTSTDILPSRLVQIPLSLRFANAVTAYVKYIVKTFFPTDLAVHYPFPAVIPLWQVIGSLIVLISISAAVIKYGKRQPYLVTGWFWFLVMLAPVLGIIPFGEHATADRYTYLSMTGIVIAVVWGITALTTKLPGRRLILALLSGGVILGATVMTQHQIGYWHDSISLFRRATQVTSHNDIAHTNLADGFLEKGYLDEAIKEYQAALKIQRNNYFARNGLGVAFQKSGNLEAAIKEYQGALMINPNYSDASHNLGIALKKRMQTNDVQRP